MGLDPLGSLREQLHLLALLFLLLLHHGHDFLRLSSFLLTVGPFFLQLLELVITFIVLLIVLLQLDVVVMELSVVGFQRVGVHLVGRFELRCQLSLLSTVKIGLLRQFLVQFINLSLKFLLFVLVVLLSLLLNGLALDAELLLLLSFLCFAGDRKVLEVFELLLALLLLLFSLLLELLKSVLLHA